MRELLNEATVYLVLLAATEQFENQATDRLQLSALEEYEDSGTTQKEDVKTTAKMLPSTLTFSPKLKKTRFNSYNTRTKHLDYYN